MNVVLFDDPTTKKNLLPFTYTRPVSEIRIGVLTIREKWQKYLPGSYSYLSDDYLKRKYPLFRSANNLYINGSIAPNYDLVGAISALKPNQCLHVGNMLLAFYGEIESVEELEMIRASVKYKKVSFNHDLLAVQNLYDIFINNEQSNRDDFELITSGRQSNHIEDPYTWVYNKENIFIEENVTIKSAILNAEKGPIYIGPNAVIGEGSIIRGATSIGEGAVLNMSTRVIGDTTIGPHCKVGGEISNAVFFGYSNKAHDGFLGNSVVGEWCNIGANTNTSNLKNNFSDVRIWNYEEEKYVNTGRRFCGLMMGDHSKSGINTMFNTGTVVGVHANIFGGGFPKTFIPSFSWGGAQEFSTYQFQKALEVISKVFQRWNKTLMKEDKEILKYIFEVSKKYRQE